MLSDDEERVDVAMDEGGGYHCQPTTQTGHTWGYPTTATDAARVGRTLETSGGNLLLQPKIDEHAVFKVRATAPAERTCSTLQRPDVNKFPLRLRRSLAAS